MHRVGDQTDDPVLLHVVGHNILPSHSPCLTQFVGGTKEHVPTESTTSMFSFLTCHHVSPPFLDWYSSLKKTGFPIIVVVYYESIKRELKSSILVVYYESIKRELKTKPIINPCLFSFSRKRERSRENHILYPGTSIF